MARIVDEDALVDAGDRRGAWPEPRWTCTTGSRPDFASPLFACDNIFTTPHVAAMTIQAQTAMAVQRA